ncbi:kinase-like domain-containing protein [Obelidium mucronatum]|nr:kinase-like domain-containing protein [Obelidium mucronatum]
MNNGRGHPNLINYYEHFELNGKFMIIMEYMGENWVDLYDYIELHGPVREDVSLEIFKNIVETLVGLHGLGYYHNDIKDENVLINTKTRQIKLIDFGSATPVPQHPNESPALCENFYGTKKFAAPEAVQGDPYDPEMQESWALGTLLFVLLFKLDPFTTDEEIMGTDICKRIAKFRALAAKTVAQQRRSHHHQQQQQVEGGGDELMGVLGDISDDAVEALAAMMEKDPTKRIKVKDILRLSAVRKAKRVMVG